jgi:hypothetical protein
MNFGLSSSLKILVLSSAVCGLTVYAQEAHDAPHSAEETAHEPPAITAEPTEEKALSNEVRLTSLLLQELARGTLALDGDRDTGAGRKAFSVWLANLSRELSQGVSKLEREEIARHEAETDYQNTLKKVRTHIDEVIEGAGEDLSQFKKSPVLSEQLADTEDLLSALGESIKEREAVRSVTIDLSFADPLSNEDAASFVTQLLAFQVNTGVVLEYDGGDLAQEMLLTGEVPASMSSGVLKAHLLAMFEPVGGDSGQPADPALPVDLPDPVYLAITLD